MSERSAAGRKQALFGMGISLISGLGWLALDLYGKRPGPYGYTDHPAQEPMLAVHGAAAITMTMLLGALLATHVSRQWRSPQRRLSGTATLAVWSLLTLTGYLLYYVSSDRYREWVHWTHIALGVSLPIWLLIHLRRTSALPADQMPDTTIVPGGCEPASKPALADGLRQSADVQRGLASITPQAARVPPAQPAASPSGQ